MVAVAVLFLLLPVTLDLETVAVSLCAVAVPAVVCLVASCCRLVPTSTAAGVFASEVEIRLIALAVIFACQPETLEQALVDLLPCVAEMV
jgi:hypothetical protein